MFLLNILQNENIKNFDYEIEEDKIFLVRKLINYLLVNEKEFRIEKGLRPMRETERLMAIALNGDVLEGNNKFFKNTKKALFELELVLEGIKEITQVSTEYLEMLNKAAPKYKRFSVNGAGPRFIDNKCIILIRGGDGTENFIIHYNEDKIDYKEEIKNIINKVEYLEKIEASKDAIRSCYLTDDERFIIKSKEKDFVYNENHTKEIDEYRFKGWTNQLKQETKEDLIKAEHESLYGMKVSEMIYDMNYKIKRG